MGEPPKAVPGTSNEEGPTKVPLRAPGDGDLREFIMSEVDRQLGPLESKIGTLSNSIERLYNSNGGPPGFLQTARKEDENRFDTIFEISMK